MSIPSTLCMLGKFSKLLLSYADFFTVKLNFVKKNCFMYTMRVSNTLDLDKDRCSVSPDLGPNCFESLSADDKVSASKEKSLWLFSSCGYDFVQYRRAI